MEQLYEIYLITNLKNNKHYVGQTKLGRHEERWNEHKKESRHQHKILYNALKKDAINNYDNFKFEVIEENIPESLIDQKEIDYIKKYNSYYKNNQGYNMTLGGQGIHGYTFTEEDKKKISQSTTKMWIELRQDSEKYNKLCKHRSNIAKGRRFSAEHRHKLSLAASKRTGSKNSFYGKHFSVESLQKLKQAKRANSPKIAQFDLISGKKIAIYNGFSEAVEKLNLPKSAVTRIKVICDANKGHAYNFIWRYLDKITEITNEMLMKEHTSARAKEVLQLDSMGNIIMEFKSAAAASRQFSSDFKTQRNIAKQIGKACNVIQDKKLYKGFF